MYLPVWRPELLLTPSRRWGILLGVVLALTLLWISRWSLSWGWLAVLGGAVVCYGALLWRRTVSLKSASAVLQICLEDDGWYLTCRNGRQGPLQLAPATWLQPFAVWLVFEALPGDERCRRGVLICSDSTDPDSFRRLQAFLRWQDRDVILPVPIAMGSADQ